MLYATYLGGEADDEGNGLAVDGAGHAYVVGTTRSLSLGVVPSLAPAIAGPSRAFIAKLSPDGRTLVYLALLGGSGGDAGNAIAVDANGAAYLAGQASSSDFPTVNAWQGVLRGPANAFVAKLDGAGAKLLYSTYLGGNLVDGSAAVVVDGQGNAYVTGTTLSTNFPAIQAVQSTNSGYHDAFVVKLDPAGTPVYSTFLGGALEEFAGGIAVDAAGHAYAIGLTSSEDFPLKEALRSTHPPYFRNAYVVALDANGGLLFSTYLGSHVGGDGGAGVATDRNGNAYVAGYTDFAFGRPFPTTPGAYQLRQASPVRDAFVAKIVEAPSPPLNDRFSDRADLVGTRLAVWVSNRDATKEAGEAAHAGEAGGRSVWWSWTAPTNGNLKITTDGSGLDTLLAVYVGPTLASLTPVASNDDAGADLRISQVKFRVESGVTYLIAVDGKNGASGNLALYLELSVPTNDDFAQRTTIEGLPANGEGSNVDATAEAGEPAHVGHTPNGTVWWSWTSPTNSFVTVTAERSAFLPKLAIYTGEVLDNLTPVAGAYYWSRTTYRAVAGTTYQIALSGDWGATGPVRLDILPARRPPNDDFSDRILLTGALVITNGATFDATTEPGEPNYLYQADIYYSGGSTVWWSWIAPTNGSALITTAGSTNAAGEEADTRIAVLTGASVGELTTVASNDDARPGLSTSRLILTNVVAGTAYHILLDRVEWVRPGDYRLSISVIQPPRLAPPQLTDGQFRFRLTGTLEQSYAMEATTDLSAAAAWVPLSTNLVSPSGTIDFVDPGAGGFARRFYRAVEVPSGGD
jgi:hypothetical protein